MIRTAVYYPRHLFASKLGCQLRIVQLIGGMGYGSIVSAEGLQKVAQYADGIGPPLQRVIRNRGGTPQVTPWVAAAHAAGLVVHPYTLRADELPSYVSSYPELVRIVFDAAKADGAFTDFPDQTLNALHALERD